MSGTDSNVRSRTSVPQQSSNRPPEMTAWVGWIVFAGAIMLMLGSFHAIWGLVALFNDEFFVVGANGLAVALDFTAWGATQLAVGVLLVLAGIGLFSGQTWARAVGIAAAVVSAAVNFGALSAYPWWSAIMIAANVLIIYAIAVHGRELRTS